MFRHDAVIESTLAKRTTPIGDVSLAMSAAEGWLGVVARVQMGSTSVNRQA